MRAELASVGQPSQHVPPAEQGSPMSILGWGLGAGAGVGD